MKTFSIAHYKLAPSELLINGGKLIVTDSAYVVKNFFKTIATFPTPQTTVQTAPPIQLYEGISLSCEGRHIDLYFHSKTAKAVYESLSLS